MIIFGGDIGVVPNAYEEMLDGLVKEYNRVVDGLTDNFSRLTGKPSGVNPIKPKENSYVDDGFQNVPGTVSTNYDLSDLDDIKTRRITTQTPQATVYIKKRLFSSLRNEHDTRFMDMGEKAFIRASKLLFERKCQQIAAYEAMTKLQTLTEDESELDISRVEGIKSVFESVKENTLVRLQEEATSAFNFIGADAADIIVNSVNNQQKKLDLITEEFEKIIKEVRISKQETNTSWVIDTTADVDRAHVGRGVGVIELTLIDTIRTSLSIGYGDMGSISFSVQDPYNITLITNSDIEMALNSATVEMNNEKAPGSTGIRGPQHWLEEARRSEEELKRTRNNRLKTYTFDVLDTTNPLSGNDLAEIVFEINPSSQAENKVTGHFAGYPATFNKDNFMLVSSQLPTEQQLTPNEITLVRNVFLFLNKYIDSINRISSQVNAFNDQKAVQYARRQLRKHYLGKSIIQPMDSVHIYMRSNTFKDKSVDGPLSALLNNSPFVRSFATDSDATDAVLKEEMRQFGIKNIPVELYKKIRTDSLLRNAGTHVFGGIISTVGKSYNAQSGQYTLSISGESNLKWLNLSRVNVSPSLDQPRGVLEDPITPLEIETDASTGLIVGKPTLSNSNIKRLGRLYYKNGVYAGKKVSQKNINQDVKMLGDQTYTVRQHAPGLVYRWKEGVISVTQQRNLRTALDGSSPQIDSIRRDVGVTVTQTPFANMDVADVISTLVTGFPHNYESFVLNGQSVGSFAFGLDDNMPESFFGSLMDITRTTNRALGNFEPIKNIEIGRDQMAKRLSLQTDLVKNNNELAKLMEKVAKLQDLRNQLSDNASVLKSGILKQLNDAKDELEKKQTKFAEKIDEGEREGLRVYGNDIVHDTSTTSNSDSASTAEIDRSSKLRSKLMKIRSQVATKLNRDRNLFIVSDEYDKDLDLQAFVTNLANGEIPIWNSEYKHPLEICINAAKVIDFEFFCDCFGHIQFRPPQYNKMPMSLLLKMMLLSKEKNINLLPPFVRALFQTRREAFEQTKKIISIDIRINNLLLFADPNKFSATNRADAAVAFEFDVLFSENVTSSISVDDVATQIMDLKNYKSRLIGTENISENSDKFKEIEKQVVDLNNPKTPNINVKRQKILNDLIRLNSQKQRVEETIAKMESSRVKESVYNDLIKNATMGDGCELTSEHSDLLGGNAIDYILGPFGNLLEDDFNDFLGPGSSSRFIIKDESVISYDFKESDKNVYCRVDVTGQEDLIGGGNGVVAGVPVIWAGATDFDLWKQYGWRSEQAISKPFFKDAESQCAPYALMLLARQKRDVVRGSVTVAGNEYYQLGDVVYINTMDTLYYVYGVSHNFSYSGGTFTTTLDLRYGHPLGEFIPTPLDVIGKNIIKNQRKFNTTFMFRKVAGADIGRTIGAIVFVPTETNSLDQAKSQMLEGDIGAINLSTLKNMLLMINRLKDSSTFNKVELRGWFVDEDNEEKVALRIDVIREWFTRPIEKFNSEDGTDSPLDNEIYPPLPNHLFLPLDPIKLPLEEENKTKGPAEESYNFMTDPDDPKGEFNTIEVVLTFRED